jgi:serine/threonine-protein kinase RsbW
VDELHAQFDAWEAAGALDGCLNEFGRHVLRLAAHEWVANLVQHAAFGRRRPEIALAVVCDGDGARCEIEDNSAGFDFHRQLSRQEAVVNGAEPSERGRGLLMLIACTEELAYTPAQGRQRLAFRVRPAGAERVGFGGLFHLPDDL